MSSPAAEKDDQPTSAARDTQTSSLTSVLSVVSNRGTVQLIKRCFMIIIIISANGIRRMYCSSFCECKQYCTVGGWVSMMIMVSSLTLEVLH